MVLTAAGFSWSCASRRVAPVVEESSVRAEPLLEDEVGRMVGYTSNRLSGCYQRYRLTYGLTPASDFIVRMRIPNDGAPHVAEIAKKTQTGQDDLELCVVETLEAIRFPAHSGEPLVVDVPIKAPKR